MLDLLQNARSSLPLTGDGLTLRLPERSDARWIGGHARHPQTALDLWLPMPYGIEGAGRLAEELVTGWDAPTRFGPSLVADHREPFVAIFFLPVDAKRPEVAYGVAPEWRARGIGTAGLRLVADWLLDSVPTLDHIELHIDPENVASIRVAERTGFTPAGKDRHEVPATGERYEDVVYRRNRTE